ncbi:MAG: DUF5336 domain-containing protein, partial [Actinomycetota bacterium]
MTAYGVPPSQQQSQPSRPAGGALPLFDLIGLVLGLIVFIVGFLPWYGGGSSEVKGYNAGSAAPAVIGLSLLAAAVAGAGLLEKPAKTTFVPLGASIAALLVVFGMLVAKGEGVDSKWGMILTLILVLLQVGAFVLSWLQRSGKIMSAKPASSAPWGGPQYGYPGGPQPYGQPPRPVPSYLPPNQPSYQPQPSYNPPPPSYTAPLHSPQQSPPPQPSYGQPGQPPGQPYQPGQSQPGQSQPGQSQPGQSQPGQSQPGQRQPG